MPRQKVSCELVTYPLIRMRVVKFFLEYVQDLISDLKHIDPKVLNYAATRLQVKLPYVYNLYLIVTLLQSLSISYLLTSLSQS